MNIFNSVIILIIIIGVFLYFFINHKTQSNNGFIVKLRTVLLPFIIIGIIIGGTTYYYSLEINFSYKILLVIQNAIGAFFGNPDLKIKDIVENLSNPGVFNLFAGIYYSISVLIAPLLTVVTVCTLLDKVISLRIIRTYFPSYKKKKKRIIFGYNNIIENWLKESKNDIEYIILTRNELDSKTTSKFVKNNSKVIFTTYEVDNISNKNNSISKMLGFNIDCEYIIFENDDNIEYKIFEKLVLLDFKENSKAKDVYIYADNEIEALRIQRFYDAISIELEDIKKEENISKKELLEKKYSKKVEIYKDKISKINLNIFNIKDLVISDLLNNSIEKEHKLIDRKNPNVHKLIFGFGTTGQKYLLQSMNLDILTSDNKIIYDVFDIDIENNKNEFLNNFSRTSLLPGDRDIILNDEKGHSYTINKENIFIVNYENADGHLEIRFHKFDVKHNKINDAIDLCALGKDQIQYNSIFICLKDAELINNIYEKVDRYILKNQNKNSVYIYIREYDGINKNYFKVLKNEKVAEIIFFNVNNISIDSLLANKTIQEAKEFNYKYENLSNPDNEKDKDSLWNSIPYFKKRSSVALSISSKNKQWLLDDINFASNVIGQNSTLKINDYSELVSAFKNEKEKYKELLEYAKIEHRRWCYFMISMGWGQTDIEKERQDEILKHDCLLTFDKLLNSKRSDTIKYDLMTLGVFEMSLGKNNLICFWLADKEYGYFSNWYLSDFIMDGKQFHSGEQWFMYAKAKLFNDNETAEQILNVSLKGSNDNKLVKELGREVRNFDETKWKSNCDELIYKGLIAKFSQNEDLKKKLLDTGDKELVEASPYDKVWGIGMEESPEVYDKSNWKGENRLGKVLMRVRDVLKK